MITKKIIIMNKLGLHARAAAKFIDRASRYASEIKIKKNSQTADGKSIIDVMMLAASQGTEIELTMEGEDEKEALADIEALIKNKFGEEE